MSRDGTHRPAWLYLSGAIATEVTGTLALRASVDAGAWIAVVVVSYLAAFALLGSALRRGLPIGVAYGIWGATGVALVALLGMALFDEHLSSATLAGIGCIIAGVVLVESGARPGPTARRSAP